VFYRRFRALVTGVAQPLKVISATAGFRIIVYNIQRQVQKQFFRPPTASN
jgi:hypothetical protein